jgi:hypothetical protein
MAKKRMQIRGKEMKRKCETKESNGIKNVQLLKHRHIPPPPLQAINSIKDKLTT